MNRVIDAAIDAPIVAAIVAMDDDRLIGNNGALPWHLPEDVKHFKALTSGHIVVMGRKTWESIPSKFRPLPGRTNIVISRNPAALSVPVGVLLASSPEGAIEMASELAQPGQKIWIIGGAEIYRSTLPLCTELHLTVVSGKHEGDAWLAEFEHEFSLAAESRGESCVFSTYQRR